MLERYRAGNFFLNQGKNRKKYKNKNIPKHIWPNKKYTPEAKTNPANNAPKIRCVFPIILIIQFRRSSDSEFVSLVKILSNSTSFVVSIFLSPPRALERRHGHVPLPNIRCAQQFVILYSSRQFLFYVAQIG